MSLNQSNSTLNDTLDRTLNDEDKRQLHALLNELGSNFDSAAQSEWKAALMERYEELCARYNEMAEDADDAIDWKAISDELLTTLRAIAKFDKRVYGCKELQADARLIDSIMGLLVKSMKTKLELDDQLKTGISAKQVANVISSFSDWDSQGIDNLTENFITDTSSDSEQQRRFSQMWMNFASFGYAYRNRQLYTLNFANGTINADVEAERPAQRRKKTLFDKNELFRMKGAETTSQGQERTMPEIMDSVVEDLERVLKTRRTDHIGMWEFVLHPTSYSETLCNLFHVACLLKEKRAKLWTLEGCPQLSLESTNIPGLSAIERVSGVMEMSTGDWKKMVELLQIKEPLIRPEPFTSPIQDNGNATADN